MSEMTEQGYKKAALKLKMQEKQLQVVKALINRSSGYAKTQAEASETRLTEEIEMLKQELKAAPASARNPVKKVKAAKVAKAPKAAKAKKAPVKKAPAKKKKSK